MVRCYISVFDAVSSLPVHEWKKVTSIVYKMLYVHTDTCLYNTQGFTIIKRDLDGSPAG